MRKKGWLAGILMFGLVCFAAQEAMAAPAYLDGVWFKMKCKAKGYKVDTATGVDTKSNLNIPFYLGFVWNSGIARYDFRVYTETAPGIWVQTSSGSQRISDFSQSFMPDFLLFLSVGAADGVFLRHTPFIRYVKDGTGAVKRASLSGIGEVFDGFFGAGSFVYYGSCKISGNTVDPSQLPFTP
jgi:hypothetical protein